MLRLIKTQTFIVILLILAINNGNSQITSSPYSIFGLGSIEGNSIGASNSMGGTGIAFMNPFTLNLQNPASTAGLDSLFAIYEIGLLGKYTSYQNSSTSKAIFDASFKYLAIGFRLKPRWAASFGITPYSTIGYNIAARADIEGSNQKFDKTYSGEGGVNQVFLGNSYKISKNLVLGISAAYLFGKVTHTESSESFAYSLRNSTYLSNINLNYGLNYQFIRNRWKYNIGLIYNNRKSLLTKNVIAIATQTQSEILKSKSYDFKIPQTFGIGFAFERNYLRGGIDYEFKKWHVNDFANPLLETRNSNKFSVGIEVPSLGVRRGAGNMIFYRAGAQYNGTYLIVDGVPINYRSVSFGAGLPFHGILSVVNLSFELGQNGTKAKGLFKESFCTLHLDFSLKDTWFKMRRYN